MHWSDAWYYGFLPAFLYFAMGVVACAFWAGASWAVYGIAGVITALVLLSIRNEYDLVTWLAPKGDDEA